MKFYPCIIINQQELIDANLHEVQFENGRIKNPSDRIMLEDYCGKPIVSIRQSTRNEQEIFVLIADGYVQYNRISNKRTVVIMGNYDTLRVILQDMFDERPYEHPFEIFSQYSYQTDINIQLDIQLWVKNTYGMPN